MKKLHKIGAEDFSFSLGVKFGSHGNGYSQCSLEVTPNMLNVYQVLHGGVIYTMVDTGMGAALATLLKNNEICATIEIKINYFQTVSSGSLMAESKVVHKGNKVAALVSEVKDGEGKLIAMASGSFYIARETDNFSIRSKSRE
ncbi:MAG: PaaI family thioesterase [bacterium]